MFERQRTLVHLYFPKSNLFYTAIPKNGITTLKNFLEDIEHAHGPTPITKDEGLHGMSVHRRTRRFKARTETPRPQQLSILVLRDPFARIASAWVNKFVFAQGDHFPLWRHRQEPWASLETFSPRELRECFEAFVINLYNSREFLLSDNHWRPQTSFFKDWTDYSIVIEVAKLNRIPDLLREKGVAPHILARSSLRHFNASDSQVFDYLWSPRTVELVETIYEQDFKALASASLLVKPPLPALEAQLPSSLSGDLLEKIIRSRLHSAQRMIAELTESKSWRYTGFIRNVISKVQN
jgi:hypothetical protein